MALVAVKLLANGFKRYRCDRPMPLGVNLTSLTKVLDIDSDTLASIYTGYGIRRTCTMPSESSEFTRIVHDLSQLGESVCIEVSKEGVRFEIEVLAYMVAF